jgi:BNR repeat-like domain
MKLKIVGRYGALAIAIALAHAQQADLPVAPGRRVVTITPDPGSYTSPSIAINPINPKQVVVGFGGHTSVGYTTDGGQTWALAQGTALTNYRSFGDNSVIFDRQGHALYGFIAGDGAGSWRYWGHNPKRNSIQVRRSLDGGKTWEPNSIPVIEHAQGGPGVPFEDKPYLVPDNQPKSPYAGNLYVAWTEDRIADSIILFSRSTDGGLTWSTPLQISDHPGGPRDDEGTVQGFSGVVTPDGALHAIWFDRGQITYTVSRDGGKTFAPSSRVAVAGPSNFMVFNAEHANGYPQIDMAVNKSGGPAALYVAWNDYRNGDVDVFLAISTDGGKTWGSPVRVNSDPIHNGADQLFQWMAVDPTSGAVNVMFYDRRRDPANKTVDVVLARSTDGARTFRNYLLSDHSYDPMDTMIGEYTGLAALGGHVYGSWVEVVAPTTPAKTGAGKPMILHVGMADFSASETGQR